MVAVNSIPLSSKKREGVLHSGTALFQRHLVYEHC